ncbi:MAG: c-type cytochrome [Pseudomonadota bacterium]
MRSTTLMAAVAICALAAMPSSAQDTDAGAKLYKKECRGCHGPTAKGLASYPKLAGQPVEYLVQRLEQYRSGQKLGPNTPLMAPRAKKLSDDDIVNIATFIAEKFE